MNADYFRAAAISKILPLILLLGYSQLIFNSKVTLSMWKNRMKYALFVNETLVGRLCRFCVCIWLIRFLILVQVQQCMLFLLSTLYLSQLLLLIFQLSWSGCAPSLSLSLSLSFIVWYRNNIGEEQQNWRLKITVPLLTLRHWITN